MEDFFSVVGGFLVKGRFCCKTFLLYALISLFIGAFSVVEAFSPIRTSLLYDCLRFNLVQNIFPFMLYDE